MVGGYLGEVVEDIGKESFCSTLVRVGVDLDPRGAVYPLLCNVPQEQVWP